ncbi:DNA-dependent protein kinase catalytic subunit [Ciona intestinalis]
MARLRECLGKLQQSLLGSDYIQVEVQIKEISQLCNQRFSKQELGLYCSLLLNKTSGILLVLNKNVSQAGLKSSRDLVLTFLVTFVPRVGSYVLEYVDDLRSSCLNVFRSDSYSRNREKALQIFNKLIENRKVGINFDGDYIRDLVSNNLFKELAKSASKTTSSVCCQVFQVLGSLARYFPGHMTTWSERLYEIFLRRIKLEMESTKTADLKIIEGCLLGLHGLMFTFTSAHDEEPVRCAEIYKYAKTSIMQRENLTRYAVPLAAMKIFRDHSSQFSNLLIDDYSAFFPAIEGWFHHKNWQLKHAAHMVIISFLRQVTRNISDGGTKDNSSIHLFNFFMYKFRAMLDSSRTSNKSLSVAIEGYGLFAGPCKRFLPKSEVRYMFTQMMNQCEKIFLFEKVDFDDNRTHQLPTFVQSLASITKQIESKDENDENPIGLPESYRTSLQRLSVLLIERYPKLHRKYSFLCHNALISVAAAFVEKQEILKTLLESIVYQGLVRCCAYDVVVGNGRDSYVDLTDQVVGEDDLNDILLDPRTITYRDYIPLWLALLGETEKKEVSYAVNDIWMCGHRKVCHEMYTAAFVKAIVAIVDKLNLETSAENKEVIENPGLTDKLKAMNVTDFKIFVNLVDICWELLPKAVNRRKSYFLAHLPDLICFMVEKSEKYPLVSGFYKLISTLMSISIKLLYFEDEHEVAEESMEHDGIRWSHDNQQNNVKCIVQKYATQVSARCKQYKDELLTACLYFLLSLPNDVCKDILPQLIPAVQRACQLGLSYSPLSEALMSALLRWRSIFICNRKCYHDIVGYLQPYFNLTEETTNCTQNTLKLKPKSRSFAQKLMSLKELDEPARKKARNQVIRFLGSMGCSDDPGDLNEDAGLAVAPWDEDVNIQYPVPFRDLKPCIRLDKFLPRVMELATQGGERKAKISACELLHSITIYIIGRNAQISNVERNTHSMASLYKKLVPVLLQLACDVDQVCKQLFDPLIKQMIHWFTNNKKFESKDTAILLNSIMEGLVDEENATLRELCADSVREFLVWSIKQNPSAEKQVRNNAKSLFKRLHSLALHPTPMKRLGAALAFNHIYRVFREQNTLVDEFIFETLVTFINSLSLSHADEMFVGTQKVCKQALEHIERIISVKSSMLCKPSDIRRIPRCFTNTTFITLGGIVEWLFDQCGRPQTECRHMCMHLFHEFIKLLPTEERSAALWVKRKLTKHGPGNLVKRFERGLVNMQPVLNKEKLTINILCGWFDHVIAAIEVYSWLFQQKILSPSIVWSGEANTSCLFKYLTYFMVNISAKSAGQLTSVASDSKGLTPKEISSFNDSKFTVVTRIMEFFSALLKNYNQEAMKVVPESMWEQECYIGLLTYAVVNPYVLGFTSTKETDLENLQTLNTSALQAALTHLPQNKNNLLVASIAEQLASTGSLFDSLPFPFGSNALHTNNPIHFITGHQTLNTCGIFLRILHEFPNKIPGANNVTSASEALISSVFDSVVKLNDSEETPTQNEVTPHNIQLGNKLLQLSLRMAEAAKKKLVNCIFSNKQVATLNFEVESHRSKGLLFLSTYSFAIYKEFCQHPALYIPLITNHTCKADASTCNFILTGVIDYLATNRTARKQQATSVCDLILCQFDKNLKPWISTDENTDNLNNLLTLIRKIIMLDSSVCTKPNHPSHSTVFTIYTSTISSNKLDLSFKNQFLDLLSFFTLSPTHSEEIKKTLDKFVSNHFPLRSSEFVAGSEKYNSYITAMRKLLDCMELSGSLEILNTMVTLYCRDQNHVMSDEIMSSLEKCVARIPVSKQCLALEIPYTIFSTSTQRSIPAAQTAIHNVLVPMAQRCNVTAVIQFFQTNIPHIMSVVQEEHIKYPESKWSCQLKMKCLAFRLLELMFALLPEDQTKPSSPVNHSFTSSQPTQSGNSLIKTFMLRVNRDRNENMKGEKVLLEERRQFHCGVYNALIAAVISTQSSIKWFKVFLFDENPSKQQYFLNNVVDCNKNYTFDTEISQPLTKRKKFVAIRKRKAEKEGETSIQYMASLAGSSLSEEISVFDRNRSLVVPNTSSANASSMSASNSTDEFEHSESQPAIATTFSGNFVELEVDSLNEHECMPALVGLITHMHENNIGFPEEEKEEESFLPPWMSTIHKKLSSSSTSKNVRLFIAKLIINCEQYFRPYAAHWLTPLAQLILREDCGVNGIDTMVCDVLVTVLSWNNIAVPEDSVEGKSLVRGLLEQLSRRIHHSNRAIIRHNLDLIKTTLECWGERVRGGVDPNIVYQLCQSTDVDLKENFAGLQLLGAFLVNKCSPFAGEYTLHVDREQYYQRIFRNMRFKRKEIYDAASEVAGLALNYITNVEKEENGNVHEMVRNNLSVLFKNPKTQDIFITCLHKVSMHFPPMVDNFVSAVTGLLPKMHGDLRTFCYEIINQRASHIDDLYQQLDIKNLITNFSVGGDPLQLASLRICSKLVMATIINTRESPTDTQYKIVLQFLPEIFKVFSKHSNPICRKETFELAMMLYDQQKRLSSTEQHSEIMKLSKIFLLKCLSDPEELLRNRAMNFWSDESRLPITPIHKVSGIFQDLYDSSLEESRFLCNAVGLILQSTSLSPDFDRAIFDLPLSECVFQEYEIDNSWRHQYASLVPMFVETLGSSSGDVNSRKQNPNMILATQQDLQFTATVEGGKSSYNWMTGSSIDTFSSLAVGDNQKSSLLASSITSPTSYRRLGRKLVTDKPGPEFGKVDLVKQGGQKKKHRGSGVNIDVQRLRRRFLKEQTDSRINFARVQEVKKRRQETFQKEHEKRRSNDVTLHRRYRDGELPDVQIPNKSIIAPLASACQYDAALSRSVLSSLVCAILKEERKKGGEEDTPANIGDKMFQILEISTEKNPSLIGCVEDVALRNHDYAGFNKLIPAHISSSSLASNKHALGITLLEQYIIDEKHSIEEPSYKRQKTLVSGMGNNPILWIELARLYKSLDEFDVLRGIFSGDSESNKSTAEGLALEDCGDFTAAYKVYNEALHKEDWDGDVSEVEKDVWEDCLINCFKNLARWDQVNAVCDAELNDYLEETSCSLKQVWKVPEYQQRFLDTSVHAKLLLLLQGNIEAGNELCEFFDDSMQGDDARKNMVEKNYSEHLAMMYIYKDDYDSAKFYADKAADSFSHQWSNLDSLMKSRKENLQCVFPRLNDINDFLDLVCGENEISSQAVKNLVSCWSNSLPNAHFGSITAWNDCIVYRSFFMEQLQKKLNIESDSMLHEDMQWMENTKFQLRLNMMKSARLQGNHAVVARLRSSLEQEHELLNSDKNLSFKLTHEAALSYLAQGESFAHNKKPNNNKIKYFIAAVECLNEQNEFITESATNIEKIHHLLALATTHHLTSSNLNNGDDADIEQVKEIFGTDTNADNIRQTLSNKAFKFYLKAAKLGEALNNMGEGGLQQKSYIAIAKYCDEQLRNGDQAEALLSPTSKSVKVEYAVTMTTYVLRAMRIQPGDLSKASWSFPRLLQLVQDFKGNILDSFIQESSALPSWMVLSWLGHMVALLDRDVASAVQPILTRVMRDYPQAIVFPFKTAFEGFKFEENEAGKKNKQFAKKVKHHLKQEVPLADEFVRQLRRICHPTTAFKDWKEDFTNLFCSKETSRMKYIVENYQNMFNDFFQCIPPAASEESSLYGDSPTSDSVGSIWTNFSKNYKAKIETTFGGQTGDKLSRMDLKQCRGEINNLYSDIEKFKLGTSSLNDYSPWLAKFQSLQRSSKELEVPGQYDGQIRPLMEYHATITGFDDKVTMMSSIRKPCKIIMRGSNEKDFGFLIKGGEDLRQDQRIQQIFVIFNQLLESDMGCRKRNLSMRTYQVIPISSKVGMIEWVDNVVPYMEFISQQAKRMNCNSCITEPARDWIPKNIAQKARNKIPCEIYGMLMQHGIYAQVVEKFKKAENMLPWDLFRQAYIRLCVNPESFVALRKRFTSSYAVMCITHWLLGIGDRHTSNFMLSLTTGEVVGIDFGHAFGSATEALQVPELVPFRLTNQIINLLSPHSAIHGELRHVMVRCLSALRSCTDTILPLLDVFVKDPSVDWAKFGKRSRDQDKRYSGNDVESSDRVWYARRKMAITKKKLEGENPASITCDELNHNSTITKFKKSYCCIASGNTKNTRFLLPKSGLSVSEQTDCLLDLATDPNVLGRMWAGWKSWI